MLHVQGSRQLSDVSVWRSQACLDHLMTPVHEATKIQHCHCTSARSMCDRRSPGCNRTGYRDEGAMLLQLPKLASRSAGVTELSTSEANDSLDPP